LLGLIAAVSRNNVIGNKGQIPWRIKGEQKKFRELTTGKIVIMGKRSFEEIGKPLPGRTTIVISNSVRYEYDNCITLGSLAEAIEYVGNREAYIAGGEQLYREALPLADRLYLTRVELLVEGDTFFPEYDPERFQLTEEERIEAEIPYTYQTYERKGFRPDVAVVEEKRYIAERDGISIRLAGESDARLLCAWWNDGKVMAHAGFPNGLSTTIEDIIGKLRRNDGRFRLILEWEHTCIGEMSYLIQGSEAEIGIKVCNTRYQEKGIGTTALRLLIEYLFYERNVDKIRLDTNLKNSRAQHVYENKIGFHKVAVHVDSWRDQLGELQSFVEYELFRKDYMALPK
jgi:dihydrofolate reductase/RimJ/RimL family protein N-acetyltransferase